MLTLHHSHCLDILRTLPEGSVQCSPYAEAHFATYPPALIKPCILAGTRPGDAVLDLFAGSGTTGEVALELGRVAILLEANAAYLPLIRRRCSRVTPGLALPPFDSPASRPREQRNLPQPDAPQKDLLESGLGESPITELFPTPTP